MGRQRLPVWSPPRTRPCPLVELPRRVSSLSLRPWPGSSSTSSRPHRSRRNRSCRSGMCTQNRGNCACAHIAGQLCAARRTGLPAPVGGRRGPGRRGLLACWLLVAGRIYRCVACFVYNGCPPGKIYGCVACFICNRSRHHMLAYMQHASNLLT